MKNVDEMANVVVNELNTEEVEHFLTTSPTMLYYSAGEMIREKFKIDVDPNVPSDGAISMKVILKVIEILKEG